jgi:hypothetical protein
LSKYTNRRLVSRLVSQSNQSKAPLSASGGRFDKRLVSLSNQSKAPLSASGGRFDRRLVSLSNHRHRSHASAYFVDHFQSFHSMQGFPLR